MRSILFALMIFTAPVSFSEALESREVRSIVQTDLSTAELEGISGDILERALFSARTTNAEYLQEVEDVLNDFIAGRINLATARLQLAQKLREVGYQAAVGEEGTLKDLSSDERINLVLEPNASMANGYGSWMQGQKPAILDQWPAQELYRAFGRKQPRNWPARWLQAGGRMFGGRMIALKNSPIWELISRFGTPYPPFDFNSGMWVRDIDRKTAIEFHLIDRDTQIAPESRGFNQDLKFTPAVRSQALRQALIEDGYKFDGDTLTL